MRRIDAGGVLVGPTPWGDLHVSEPLDEVTLVRLVRGLAGCGLTPNQVTGASIGQGTIMFEYHDDPPWFHDGELVIRQIVANA